MFGEGPVSWRSHIVLPREWYDKLPTALRMEQERIEQIPDLDRTNTSRIATEVILTKDMEGLVAFVPDPPPTDQPKRNAREHF